MSLPFDQTLLRWAAILMLAGGISFWTGALTPPYKQWMTSDTREYLTIIHGHKINWYIIAGTMMLGIILTVLAVQLMAQAVNYTSINRLWSILNTASFSFGAVFVIVNFGFRLTVTMWAGDQLAATGQVENWFQTWMDWSNLLFAVYMVLAYFSVACLGLAMRDVAFLPHWLIWFCIIFGFGGVLGFVIQFPLFAPPLMVHLPYMIVAILILLKLKS
ncbi:MAG TPA: hypothetical protein VJ508_10470 [Saprospiraceae bacterium]|nr:hypothetical protein [Saprospiraceae bacterium]